MTLTFILAQVPDTNALRIESWVAAGGTYGLIVALVYAVRYLVKRDEKTTEKLIEALGSTVAQATHDISASTEEMKANRAETMKLEARITAMEHSLKARCPFLTGGDTAEDALTAKALAGRLLRKEGNHPAPDG